LDLGTAKRRIIQGALGGQANKGEQAFAMAAFAPWSIHRRGSRQRVRPQAPFPESRQGLAHRCF